MARRSVLFSPGDQPDLLRKAPGTGADVLVFDLEDAVAPDRKETARESVREALADIETDAEVCVRVNAAGTGAAADLDVVLDGPGPDSIMVPKVAGPDHVRTVDDLLAERGAQLPVLALVETAAGVLNAEEIAATTPTDALVFGAEDLAADMGATRTDEGTEILYAREHVVLAAAAAGVDAIDTLHTDFEDTERLREETAFALELGYDGKLAIHPSQVAPINETFTPDPERVEWAEKVLAARERAHEEGQGVFEVDGEMIDQPLITQAERVRERALAAGLEFEP